MREALDTWHMGKVIRAFRLHSYHARRITQKTTASWDGISQAQLNRFENGKAEQSLDRLTRWAIILGIPHELLWFKIRNSSPGLSVALPVAVGLDENSSNSRLAIRNPTTSARYKESDGQLRSPSSDQILEATLLDTADESAKFLAWAEIGNVGELTIEQIHSDIRRISRSYLKAPTLPLFERTRGLRDRVFALLEGHQKPSQSRDLYSAAGWCLTVLAWISTDLGHPSIAEEHLRSAWLCAENADHNSLRAWIRATQHTAAFWQDDFIRAAQSAEDGLRYATSGSAELFLASAWALDLARCGDAERSQKALTRARNAADSAGCHDLTDELMGPFTCTVGRAGGFWSDTYLAIGDAAAALSYADNAVSAFEATADSDRNLGSERMVRCQRVKAHLTLNEFDGAMEALRPVLNTAPEHRMGPLIRRMHEIMRMAIDVGQQRTPIIAEIRDAATEFQTVSPLKSLPR